jgi:transposase
MKKFLFFTLLFGALISTTANAQAGDEPTNVLQQMKDKQVPGLIEKVGLTKEQANKVIELNYEMRMKASAEFKDLPEAERGKRMAELKAEKEKKFAEFLKPEQIAALKAYYEEMGKNRQVKSGK